LDWVHPAACHINPIDLVLMKLRSLFATLALCTGLVSAVSAKTVVEIAIGSPDHTTLVAAVKAAGLVETLSGAGPFTVFAPTNAAFAASGITTAMIEAMPVDTLARLDRAATSRPSREHVTWFIHAERPDLFERVNVQAESDYAALRWTVDTPEDLAFVRAVDAALGTATHTLPWLQVARWLEAHPEVAALNQAVAQKAH